MAGHTVLTALTRSNLAEDAQMYQAYCSHDLFAG